MNLNPLEQIDVLVIVAVALIVTATYFGLRRFFVVPYLNVMEDREEFIERAEAQRAEGEALLESSHDEAQTLLASAQEDATAHLQDATMRAEAYRTEVLQAATAEASQRLEKGRAEIERQRCAAREEMREQALDCVELACTRLIGSTNGSSIPDAVDEALARFAR